MSLQDDAKIPPYSPDLSPCDFHIFGDLKKNVRAHRFASTETCYTGQRTGSVGSLQTFSRMRWIVLSYNGISV